MSSSPSPSTALPAKAKAKSSQSFRWSSLFTACACGGPPGPDPADDPADDPAADQQLKGQAHKSYGTLQVEIAEPLPSSSATLPGHSWIAASMDPTASSSSTSLAASAAAKVPAAARGFLDFVNASPSPFHAVAEARKRLDAAGFTLLKERECWDGKLVPGGKYYFTRNASSVIAFVVGQKFKPGNGFAMVAAHTDSPCLKLKPVSNKTKNGYLMVGVQTYGGGLWHTWFDRDLGVAGRVIVNGKEHRLVKVDQPILRIPTLAIHLDRAVNDGFTFNKENHLIPVLASVAEAELNAPAPGTKKEDGAKHHSVLLSLLAEQMGANVDPATINDVELCLFDTTPAVVGGALSEYVFAPRCDNLVMSYTGLSALLNHAADKEAVANDEAVALVALFDNEEVGSLSAYGADSHFLEAALRRVTSGVATDAHGRSSSAFEEAMQKSYLVSADMAHALHPNHADKHEDLHQPRMNKGVVIKHNANQRYATTAPTSALLRAAAARAGVALQEFVVRNDSPCGSTIGPILSGKLGLRTIDVGNPQLSMHSIREQAGTRDIEDAIALFTAVFKHFAQIDKELIVD